ncbi:MAG: hypothetical protein ACK5AL_13315 [Planctomycetota bacterium]
MARFVIAGLPLLCLAASAAAQGVPEGPEPNQSPATATALPLGAEAAGALAGAADADWYALSVPAGVRLRIETGPGVGVQARDTVVTLLDAGGAPICSNDDGVASGWYARLVTPALAAGTYFLAVEAGAAAVAGGAYALDGRAVAVPAFAGATAVEGPENNDPRSGGAATVVTLPERCSGVVSAPGVAGDWDFYRFTLANDALVEARVDATPTHPSPARLDDPVLYLFDGATPPNLLAGPFQSRSFGVYDAWLEARLPAGVYQLAIRGWSGSIAGAYYLDVVRRDAARATVAAGGCGGRSLAVPATDAGPGAPLRLERPVLGATWSLLGSNLGAGGFVFHVVGLQATFVDLAPFGAPGCALEVVYLDTPLQVADGLGRTTFRLRLPDTPSLLGAAIESQAAVFDLSNALGVTFSNRVTAALGH